MKKIEQLMSEQEIFKDSSLSIDSLAVQVGIKRHNVSVAINRCTQKNFNTFVNEYRIKHIIRVLSDNDRRPLSVEGVAFASGFSEPRNFYRVFKKITGLTPTEFLNNIEKNR
jgi:AraC-like DNA-binding protein